MNEKQLPELLEESLRSGRKQTARFFQYLHRWRTWLFFHWSKITGDKDSHLLPEATDQLIGLILLLTHCRMSYGTNVSIEKILETGCVRTYNELLTAIRQELTCPILKRVFAADESNDLPLDVSLFSNQIESRLESAILLLLRQKSVPLWLFGDYHQFCVATPPNKNRIQRSFGERYSRGIHYTPAPLVDYLSTSVIDGFVQDNCSKNCKILDPSCGCGSFLIASFRYLVQRKLNQYASVPNHPVSANDVFDILKNSIYGTDIDHRAIKWAQKLLYLTAKHFEDFLWLATHRISFTEVHLPARSWITKSARICFWPTSTAVFSGITLNPACKSMGANTA
ncbi:MAG: N-6 DNA methylase [Planctomycetaceae bacterium]|nr:N-6 DNA methylase [Planctomycetaceae bacterium]